jgi:exportin-2 (importin alpha re-exporter)
MVPLIMGCPSRVITQ